MATTLLRLRQINGAVDVSLNESARPVPVPSVDGVTPTSEVAADGCGDGYTFAATVVLEPAPAVPSESHGVPSSLGGGS